MKNVLYIRDAENSEPLDRVRCERGLNLFDVVEGSRKDSRSAGELVAKVASKDYDAVFMENAIFSDYVEYLKNGSIKRGARLIFIAEGEIYDFLANDLGKVA